MELVAREYDGLSQQLKAVGRYVESRQEHYGLVRIRSVARECGVHPSAVVRFAKHFGFAGFSAMQVPFRAELMQRLTSSHKHESKANAAARSGTPDSRLHQIVGRSVRQHSAVLDRLWSELDECALARAAELLAGAESVWLTGSGHRFSVAVYLNYLLLANGKPVEFLSELDDAPAVRLRSMREGDVLIAVHFMLDDEEVVPIAQQARLQGAKLIAISNGRPDEIAIDADVTLAVAQSSDSCSGSALISAICITECLCASLPGGNGPSVWLVAPHCEVDHDTVAEGRLLYPAQQS